MSFKKDVKKNLTKMADRSGETVMEVRRGMKSMWLSGKIRKELEAGIPLEDILFFRVPTADVNLVREDAQALLDGIQSLYDATQRDVNTAWVEQEINKALTNLDAEKRVSYLRNAITAVMTAYPGITLDEEETAILERAGSAEEPASVDELLHMTGSVLPQFGELLQRSSAAAMLDRLHKLDREMVEKQTNFGMNSVTAYAAACYIMQKCGEDVTVNGQEHLSVYALGAAAAASVESSRLMELYSTGKISLDILCSKLKNMYTAVVTYTFGSMTQFVASAAYVATIIAGAELFTALFLELGAFLYFSPVVLLAGSAALSAALITSAFSVSDYEAAVQSVWDLLKNLWSKLKSYWDELSAAAEDEEVVEIDVEDETEDEDEEEIDGDPDGVFA